MRLTLTKTFYRLTLALQSKSSDVHIICSRRLFVLEKILVPLVTTTSTRLAKKMSTQRRTRSYPHTQIRTPHITSFYAYRTCTSSRRILWTHTINNFSSFSVFYIIFFYIYQQHLFLYRIQLKPNAKPKAPPPLISASRIPGSAEGTHSYSTNHGP